MPNSPVQSCSVPSHDLTQAFRPHVGPVLVDIVQARRPGRFPVHHAPAGWNVREGRPQAVLLLVVDQHEEGTVVVIEGVGAHGFLPLSGLYPSEPASPAAAGRCVVMLPPSTRSDSNPRQLRLGNPGPWLSPDRFGRNNFGVTPVMARS